MKITSLTTLSEQTISHNPEIKKKVMLGSGDLPHLTNFSQARFAPGQVAVAHSHPDMWEVFFVSEGEGVIAIDGAAYFLQPGTCVAVAPGEVHELSNPGPAELIVTYLGLRV